MKKKKLWNSNYICGTISISGSSKNRLKDDYAHVIKLLSGRWGSDDYEISSTVILFSNINDKLQY